MEGWRVACGGHRSSRGSEPGGLACGMPTHELVRGRLGGPREVCELSRPGSSLVAGLWPGPRLGSWSRQAVVSAFRSPWRAPPGCSEPPPVRPLPLKAQLPSFFFLFFPCCGSRNQLEASRACLPLSVQRAG